MVDRGGAGAVLAKGRALFMLASFAAGGVLLLRQDASRNTSLQSAQPSAAEMRASFARLPISFEPNQGQTDAQVRFLAHGTGYGLYFLPAEAVLKLPGSRQSGSGGIELRMQLARANRQAEISGADRLPGYSNYLIGNDPSRWHRHVPHFARVQYREIYPHIALSFYGKQNRVEYDFEVAPGGDPRQIELQFKDGVKLSPAGKGDLVVAVSGRELRLEAPHVYQQLSSGVRSIPTSFVFRDRRVGFEVGPYDHSRTLVIDPVIVFSTYLGGAGDESCTVLTSASSGFVPHCPAVAVDSASNIYVAGATNTPAASLFGGVTPNATNSKGASENVFVARIGLSSSGAVLNFVTYIGGSTPAPVVQYPVGVGVDSGFNIYIAGTTNASDYPVTSSAFQSAPGSSGNHVFISKLDSTGSSNLYSTYLSGSGIDTASGMTVDSQGLVYVIGTTTSPNFPPTPGALQPTPNATNQFFFSKVNPALSVASSLQYSTYIGGSTPSNGMVTGGAVAVDSNFNVYLAGGTSFTNMPLVNAYQSTENGAMNVWAARLNAPASNTQQYTPLYETYLGGSGTDVAYGIATDNTNSYLTGSTSSSNVTIPTATSPFQTAYGGGSSDAFVAKFGVPATSGTTQGSVPLLYYSYLGGNAADVGLAIVADSLSNARVTGLTYSTNFPLASPFQGFGGGTSSDAFVARLITTGTSSSTNTSMSSYLGGSGTDIGTSIALDSALNTYLAGETSSSNFPKNSPLAAGASLAGPSDAFVSKIGPNSSGLTMPQPTPAGALPACGAANPSVSPSPAGVGSQVTFTYYIYNMSLTPSGTATGAGDPVPGVLFTDNLGSNSGSASASQGSCASASNGTISCFLGTVNSSTQTAVTPSSSNCNAAISTNFAAKVTVTVTAPTTALQGQSSLGNSATLSFAGTTLPSVSGTAVLNDFTVSAVPPTAATIASGAQANYTIQVVPTGSGFPESVSLACGSGLPSGASCTFTNNPIPNMSSGPQSRALAIKTTARVTTPSSLFRRGPTYAIWLPVLGFGFIGAHGISRKRRLLLAVFFAVVLGVAVLQAACGSSSKSTPTTSGTPPGTYTITVNGTSGSATRTTTVQLTVQ
jgi:hypothetical protein